MGAARRDMRDVVLVEVGSEAVPAADPERAAPGRTGDSRVRRSRWWAAGVALALVVVAGGAVSELREGARLASLAGVPGVLAPLDGPVTELWRSTGPTYLGLSRYGGMLLAVQHDVDDGSVDVVALDALTGGEA